MKNSNIKLVTVLISRFLYELQIAKGKLESEGIKSFIVDEHMSTIGFSEEYRLQIDAEDVLKAKFIGLKFS